MGRKKHNVFRTVVQALSFAFHNGYLRGWVKKGIYSEDNKAFCVPGLNCYSCPGAVGACPIGSLQAALDSGAVRASLIVISFIAMVGFLCGRLVCGFLCPFGFVQDLFNKIPVFKKVKNLPGHKYLRYLRFVILAVFVVILPMTVLNAAGKGQPWFCEWICPSGTLLGGIPLVLMNSSIGHLGFRFWWKIFLLAAILVGSVKYYRPFCKYICPLGALYGVCNPVSTYRIKVDSEKCTKCGACQRACGMDIRVWEKPNSVDCIRCGNCMATCPNGALSSTWDSLFKSKENTIRTDDKAEEFAQKVMVATQAKNRTHLKKGMGIFLTVVSALLGLYNLYMIFVYIYQTYIYDISDAMVYEYPYVTALAMSVLVFITGLKFIRNSKVSDNDDELRQLCNIDAVFGTVVCVLGSIIMVLLVGIARYTFTTYLLTIVANNLFRVVGSVILIVSALIAKTALKKKDRT